jgi:hypothetical protein
MDLARAEQQVITGFAVEVAVIPSGLLMPGPVKSVTTPETLIRPMALLPQSVNQRVPPGLAAMPCGK